MPKRTYKTTLNIQTKTNAFPHILEYIRYFLIIRMYSDDIGFRFMFEFFSVNLIRIQDIRYHYDISHQSVCGLIETLPLPSPLLSPLFSSFLSPCPCSFTFIFTLGLLPRFLGFSYHCILLTYNVNLTGQHLPMREHT